MAELHTIHVSPHKEGGFLDKHERLKDLLFGKDDGTGNRKGGLASLAQGGTGDAPATPQFQVPQAQLEAAPQLAVPQLVSDKNNKTNVQPMTHADVDNFLSAVRTHLKKKMSK